MQTSGALRRMLCSPIFPEESWVLEWIPIRVGYVWTGKYDFKTDTCARGNFWIRKKGADSKISGYMWTGSQYITLGTRGFSRVRRKFSKAARDHYKDLTETGNALQKSVAPRVQCTEHYKYIHFHHHRHLQKIWSAKICKLKIYLQSLYQVSCNMDQDNEIRYLVLKTERRNERFLSQWGTWRNSSTQISLIKIVKIDTDLIAIR